MITSIDDHSRDLLYADLWIKETSWAHIVAVKTVRYPHWLSLDVLRGKPLDLSVHCETRYGLVQSADKRRGGHRTVEGGLD